MRLFPRRRRNAGEAQRNKLRLIASKLRLKPGLKVLDIGCGWGDLALYLAAMEDVDVTGVTLSKEQHALANEKAQGRRAVATACASSCATTATWTRRFDRIVSVGMFEHVGVHHYGEFFAQDQRAARPTTA